MRKASVTCMIRNLCTHPICHTTLQYHPLSLTCVYDRGQWWCICTKTPRIDGALYCTTSKSYDDVFIYICTHTLGHISCAMLSKNEDLGSWCYFQLAAIHSYVKGWLALGGTVPCQALLACSTHTDQQCITTRLSNHSGNSRKHKLQPQTRERTRSFKPYIPCSIIQNHTTLQKEWTCQA